MSRARSVSQLVGANTALGNTVITGTANVSSTLAAGNTSVSGTVSLTYSNATSYTTSTRVGSGLSIYNSSNTNSYAGIELLTEPTSGNAGICGIAGVSTGSGDSALVFGTRGSSTYAERMRIDASGRITLPFNPSFCYWQSDASSSTQNPTVNNGVVTFRGSSQGGQHNRGSYYSTSTGRFTAPVTGTYHFDLHWIMNQATVSSECNYGMRINGGALTVDGRNRGYTESSGQVSVNLYLNTGDYVEVVKSDTSGISMYPSDRYSWFSGFLVG